MWPFGKNEKEVKEKRFEEEYEDYVKRKKEERGKDESKILKTLPDLEEVKKRASLPTDSAKKRSANQWVTTGVSGFDELLAKGVPRGVSILVAGGPGSGKTVFCLQTLYSKAVEGKKGIYISFEESEDRLYQHMKEFGWKTDEIIKKDLLRVYRVDPFKISRAVEALLAKSKGELLIKMEDIPELIPKNFNPDFIVLDSLSALGAAFIGKESGYRVYIEQLFKFLEKRGVTSFLISETDQVPTTYSRTGVEEFLADGVIVFYNTKKSNSRVRAVEILKMRGAKHEKKIVPFEITDKGIVVYPNEPVFMED